MFHPQGPTFWELAEQCLSSTERGYDLLAPKFEYTPFRTPDEILDGLAKYLGPPRSIDAALDICCGTGAAMRILRPLCRERVVGIDFSQRMLDVARQRFPDEAGQAPVELVRGDVLDMQFHEEFDLAVTVGSLGHILPKDEPRFVERIAAALRPGGRFAFVTCHMPPWYSRQYLLSRGFNAAMHVRNALVRPPFVMFYLTFLLPQAKILLERHGFDVAVHNEAFSERLRGLEVVVATKQAGQDSVAPATRGQ
ncbi:MAG: class I SAM-dependent methyltransferase [Planctomycetaceae bacterium]|nr:class I SAM-dependent methyltransferase [Planctomycetaceae bacterium]